MEPTIYKPGTYKSPGIYKGAGGIYNGHGVYNVGTLYNGPFVLLNNCDNIDGENVCKSEIGNNLYVNENLPFGELVNSQIFAGSRSIKRTNNNYVRIRDISVDDVFTIEFYISNITASDVYALSIFCIDSRASSNSLVVGGDRIYNFETSYPVINWGGTYKAIKMPFVKNAHFAAVVNKKKKKVYCFVNGVKIGSYKYTDFYEQRISQNGDGTTGVIEFFCVRNGDFSNNLNSFEVPTQKYSL